MIQVVECVDGDADNCEKCTWNERNGGEGGGFRGGFEMLTTESDT